MQALLGIDIGTTGVKAALFAANDGHVMSSAFVDYPLVHTQPGWAEQDPEDSWQATFAATRCCLSTVAQHGVTPATVHGIGPSRELHVVHLLPTTGKTV